METSSPGGWFIKPNEIRAMPFESVSAENVCVLPSGSCTEKFTFAPEIPLAFWSRANTATVCSPLQRAMGPARNARTSSEITGATDAPRAVFAEAIKITLTELRNLNAGGRSLRAPFEARVLKILNINGGLFLGVRDRVSELRRAAVGSVKLEKVITYLIA